jgi:hypothetical protein
MYQYEKDFIYKTLPELTKAVNNLAAELKRYNNNQSKTNNEPENTSGDDDTKAKSH